MVIQHDKVIKLLVAADPSLSRILFPNQESDEAEREEMEGLPLALAWVLQSGRWSSLPCLLINEVGDHSHSP